MPDGSAIEVGTRVRISASADTYPKHYGTVDRVLKPNAHVKITHDPQCYPFTAGATYPISDLEPGRCP